MHTPHKFRYLLQVTLSNPSELLRLAGVAWTTFIYRFIKRCAGPGTVVEPGTRAIHPANIRIGAGCLIKEGVYLRAGPEGRVIIHDRAALNAFCRIFGHGGVEIGRETQIGPATLITTTGHDYREGLETSYRPVCIGERVWIGANVTILPGVTIGDRAVIGAGAVVNRDIPAGTLAVGVPARVVRTIT